MSLHVFTGLPGSGKSSRLIELVNEARSQGKPVRTFACSESPILAQRERLTVEHALGCRRPGLTCPLDHFVPTDTATNILSRLDPATLAAFEEAQFFAPEIVPHWLEASRRGVQIVISTPSLPQLELLKGQPLTETEFTTECQKCGASKASTFLVVPESPTRETMALCSGCKEQMMDVARRDLLERLRRQAPHPGEKAIYQPIDELPETADWKIVRPDSKARADVMVKVIQEAGLPGNLGPTAASYVDVGCNTGYFCDRIRRLGFYSEGVDAVKGDIEVARILDSYFRNGHTHFILQDAYDYLEETQDRTFDVTSAFAVFQWVMIQTSVERGITCLERLFAKTKRRCFLEMGYSAEPQYRERLKTNIDREWVRRIMEEKGGFSEIRIFDAKEHGLMFGRDVFVGIKAGVPAAVPSPVKDESEPPRADDVDGQ
jgi:SAM-dependent methyltransferase